MFIAHTQYVYSCKLCHIQLASLNQLLNRARFYVSYRILLLKRGLA